MNKGVFILLMFFSMGLWSQKDTTYLLDTIEIGRQNRFEQKSEFSQESLNFSEELERKSPVFIKNYGTGNLATISYQGTSNSQNSLYWEDVNLTPMNSGTVDYSLVDAFLFSDYSFQSSQNTLQGSGIGADLVLENNLNLDSGWHAKNLINLGSFHDSKIGLQWSKSTKKNNLSISFLGANAKNDFKFYNPSSKEFESRANNRNQFVGSMFAYEYNAKQILWCFKSWNRYSDREIPSPVHIENQMESQEDVFSRNILSASTYLPRNWKWKQSLAYLYENYLYQNPKADISGFGELNRMNYNGNWSKDFNAKLSMNVGLFGDGVKGLISDLNRSRYLLGFSALAKYDLNKKWQFKVSMRKELYRLEQNLPLVLDFSVSYSHKKMRFYLKAQKNARKPTLNDLYWKNGGNINLDSENAQTAYFGVSRKGSLSIQSEFFAGDISQMIIWLPNTDNGLWQPQNIAQVQRIGGNLEIKKELKINQNLLEMAVLYAFTSSRDENNMQLIYMPVNQLKAWLDYKSKKKWGLNGDFQMNGKRFVTKDHSAYLPMFVLADLSISKEFTWLKTVSTKISVDVKNLTNYTYYNIPFRPMPGRYFGLTIQNVF